MSRGWGQALNVKRWRRRTSLVVGKDGDALLGVLWEDVVVAFDALDEAVRASEGEHDGATLLRESGR